MAISTQIQNLNLIPGKSAPVVVHLSQGNVGNTVQFYLYDGDNPYYPSGVSIAVHGVRADGSVFGPYAVSTTSGNNLVSFNIVSAMTSVNGAAIGELVITDSSQNQIGSANFGMLVEATPYSSSVTYEDDLSIYQRILAYVQSIPAELQSEISAEVTARQNAITAEANTRAAADTNLQTQINQIIAPSGEAPSAAEVQNARIGADGTIYDTLGIAIRGQITDLKSDLDDNEDDILSLQRETGIEKKYNNKINHTGTITYSNTKTKAYAEQGWKVSIKVDDNNNDGFEYFLYAKYAEDAEETSLGKVGVEGVSYSFISAKTLEDVGVYAISLSDGTVSIEVTVNNDNGIKQKLEEKVDKNGRKQVKTENIQDINSNILYSEKNIIVSGTTSYVFKLIYTYTGTINKGDKFLILVDDVTGATATNPYAIYLKNGDVNIRTRQYEDIEITQSDISNGVNKIEFELYPAKGTKLPTNSATFKGVEIIKGTNVDIEVTDNLKKAIQTSINGSYCGDVPSYYFENNYLIDKADRVNELGERCSGNGDVFLFITDEHYDLGYNQKHSPALVQYLSRKCRLPRLFDGGDTANGGNTEWINMIHAGFNHDIHHVMGNHDWMLDRSGDYLAYWFDSFGHEQVGVADKHYYYVDNKQKRIRYIVLNTWKSDLSQSNTLVSAYDNEQLSWFTNTAMNVESGWSIIIFTHYIKVGSNIAPSGALGFLNAVDNYSGNGEIICIIEGHTHYDSISSTAKGVPIINTTCDKNGPWISGGEDMEPWLTSQRLDQTIDEQAFDVCIVDRENSLIRAVRIGAKAMKNYVDENSSGFTPTNLFEERIIHYEPVNVSTSTTLTSLLDGTISWETSNSNVATVSGGVVAKVSAGSCIVAAYNESLYEAWIITT